MNDLVLAVATGVAGIATGGLVYLAARRRRPSAEAGEEEPVPLEVVEETIVVPARVGAAASDDAPFSYAPGAAPARAPVPVAAAPRGGSVPLLATQAPRRTALVLNRGIGPTYDPDDPPELPDSSIPTEWARRLIGGHPDPGRMKGLCSGCGTHLSISQQRPVRIACPVCGRTRLLGA